MAKFNPAAGDDSRRLDDRVGIADFVEEVVRKLEADDRDRLGWMETRREGYNRRFASSQFDKPIGTYPWIGASNIDSGLSDIHIEELKPPLMNLTFGSRRIYEMVPLNAGDAAHEAAASADMAMDSLFKYRMPDYVLQTAWGIDSLGTYGLKTDKALYSYKTRQTTRVIQRDRLPFWIARMAVYGEFDESDRRVFEIYGAVGMSREEFDAGFVQIGERQEKIEDLVVDGFGFDLEDKIDRVALAEVMQFLRNGSGTSALTFKTRQVVEDTPRIINIPIENVVVPMGTRQIHEASRIAHYMFFDEGEMRQRARDEVWDSKAVDAALEGGDVGSMVRTSEMLGNVLAQAKIDRSRTLNSSAPEKLFRVAEIYTRWDIDGDGLDENVVLTIEPKSKTVLKAIPWDEDWPFTDTFLEATDQDRHASRGVPQQICDYERHTTGLMRGELNNLLIETSRSFTYLESSGIDPMKISWMPTLMIPVRDHDDLKAIEMRPNALALEQPMRNMMGLAERRVSGFNRGVLDNPPPERRTATEIQMFQGSRQAVMTTRALLYQEGQKRNGRLIWDLWQKHGPDKFWTHVTGQPPLRQSQAQINGEYLILPVGAAGDTDPEFRSQRAFRRLSTAMQMRQLLTDDPRWRDDLAQAYIDWLNEDDPQATQRLIKEIPPEMQKAIADRQEQLAQRAQELASIGQAVLAGAPISEEEGRKLLEAIRKMSPMPELQQIIVESQAARRTSDRTQEILAANGAPS